MSPENFIVPQLAGSPWARYPHTVADMDWPTVGVYCSHDPDPWLLGSFSISAAVAEEKAERYWAWRADYITGDGYVIHLRRVSGRTGAQSLVGNELYDRSAARARLAELTERGDYESPEVVAALAEMQRANTELRGHMELACGRCRDKYRCVPESVQALLDDCWSIGIRELPLAALRREVGRRRAGRLRNL